MDPIKIFIVEDHRMVRKGLVTVLQEMNEISILGEATNGKEAFAKIGALEEKPDVVLTDVNMPEMDGIEFTKELHKEFPEIRVIALTMVRQSALIKKMLQSGAVGYILKDSDVNELKKAIISVNNNETYYSPEVASEVITHLRGSNSQSSGVVQFSKRENEVLDLLVKDKSNQEIADTLFISIRTVESHKQNLLAKTHSNSVAGLVVYAIKHQLVDI